MTSALPIILASVSNKCPGFKKWLRYSKSEFVAFSNSAGHQKWPELSASDQRIMKVMGTAIKCILILLLNYIIWYTLEEDDMDPKGKLF